MCKLQIGDSVKTRTIKSDVEKHSEVLNRMVSTLVNKYCRELDNAIDEINEMLKNKDTIHEDRLQYYIAYLPVLMYYASNSLEDLGIEGDTAKVIRQDAFNQAYLECGGKTVQEKTSLAQNLAMNEQLVENAFNRAYKKAKSRMEVANTLHSALKKILQWKISEMEVTRNNTSNNGTNFGGY